MLFCPGCWGADPERAGDVCLVDPPGDPGVFGGGLEAQGWPAGPHGQLRGPGFAPTGDAALVGFVTGKL